MSVSAPAVGRIIEETGIHEDPAESNTGLVGNAADADAVNKDAQTGDTENGDNTVNKVNILVACFSAINTTEGLVEYIVNGLSAGLYEVVPEEAYTDADLSYNDDSSRNIIEMNDPSSRSAVFGGVENIEQYDIVFIGYPIWWGEAPRIVSTFMESYDFSGKTLTPFCTSGGSGLGSSASNLAELTDGAQRLSGQRLGGEGSQDEVMEWVNRLGLAISAEQRRTVGHGGAECFIQAT